ncbi:MAG: hypothetical protein V3V75_02775 [Thermoguttaceae bacterium]
MRTIRAMDRSRRIIALVLLGLLALGLRVCVVLALWSEHDGPLAYEHGQIAENLLAGRGFSIEFLGSEGPTSQQAPFYPLLLAGIYWLFGTATPEAILAVQLLQCVAGTALVLAVAWLAWLLVPDRPSVGVIAALGAAVYPAHVYMVTHLQVAVWAALLLTLLLAVVLSPYWRSTRGGALLAGSLAGVLLLVEPILALALPICALAFWLAEGEVTWHGRFTRSAMGRVALMAAVAALIIAPWTVRNWMVHGQPVFVKSTFGYAFWQGNNPISWGTDKIPKPSAELLRKDHDSTPADMDRALWEARHETLYIDDVLLGPGDYGEFAGLSEPQRSKLLGRRGWEFVRAEPYRYAGLCLRRLRYFLLFDETNPKASNRLYRVSTVAWLVIASIGVVIYRGRWRRLWPTYAIFATVTLFHTMVIVSARFRIPIEPISFVWAAMAVAPVLVGLLSYRPVRVYRPGQRPRDPFVDEHVLRGPHYNIKKGRGVRG